MRQSEELFDLLISALESIGAVAAVRLWKISKVWEAINTRRGSARYISDINDKRLTVEKV